MKKLSKKAKSNKKKKSRTRFKRNNPETTTKSDIEEMREWLKEIDWRDMDPEDIDELSDAEIINGVKRHYAGGIKQFLEDGK